MTDMPPKSLADPRGGATPPVHRTTASQAGDASPAANSASSMREAPFPAEAVRDAAYIAEPVLAFETSGRVAGVALVCGGRVLSETVLDAETTREEWLLTLAHDALARTGLASRSLARIGVSLGPGSFTGLRVGLAAARALAFASGRPMVAVPTHEAMAFSQVSAERGIVLLTSRRRKTVCVEAGSWEQGEWTPVVPACCVPEESLMDLLAEAVGRLPLPLLFLGEAVESMLAIHPALTEQGSPIVDPLSQVRRPLAVALLASRTKRRLWHGSEMDAVEPLYLRAADAKKPARRV